MSKGFGWSLVLVLGLVPAVWAQSSGGNVYGTVVDQSGAALPGTTVTIASSELGGTRSTVTGSLGEFRFLNLDHATYKLTVAVQGFATVTRDVIVNTGVNVELSFSMKVAALQESIAVTAETPVVDLKKVGTSTTMTKDELSEVPQGRDPWAILKNVPGVLVDRVSIAGSEAGQQSLFVAKGAQQNDTMWNLDGISITDTTSFGASSAYFDFDAFDEINVTTGGGDLKVASGGVGLNFVTKRGTNAFHGNVHLFGTNHKFGESSNTPAGIASSSLLDGRADSIRQIG
ncbi:MAG TPA: carboxypeptidase regulatory-like domain-containing protein, partial [Vicinamibacteria bacterium]|nr:carboxypeptidase regulatory-like domain-containing protein [Vicinamibacteria bacterium]